MLSWERSETMGMRSGRSKGSPPVRRILETLRETKMRERRRSSARVR